MRPLCPLALLTLGSIAQGLASPKSRRPSSRDIETSVEPRGEVEDIWNDIKSATTCAACEAVLLLLKGLADLGNDAFIEAATEVCELAKVEDDDVCQGAIALEGPIIAGVLREMTIGSATSELFCNTFMGLCSYPTIPAWTVPVSSPTDQDDDDPPLPSGQDPIKVVQFSDIHVDPLYVTGSSTNCTKPICCRPYTASDEPGESKTPAGPNGEHTCDTPISLELSMYKAIKEIVPDAAFTLFTGDIVDHAVWNTSESYNENSINNAYNYMNEYFDIVYGTAGNHEASPVNSFPPVSVSNSSQWVLDTLYDQWNRLIGADESIMTETEMTGAYSVMYPYGNLRIISLNTNLYYRMNFWMYQPTMEQDPDGQIQWLVDELEAAEEAGVRVYIIAHMPLGVSDAFQAASNYIDQVVNRYSSTIAAMFFGHTHLDHFEISYSNYSNREASNAVMTSYICPSLTPMAGMPSFRVYDVDPVTFAVLDATTYMADMTNPDYQTTGPVWTKYYSAKEAYGALLDPPVTDPAAELTPAFWHNVTAMFAANSSAFNDYYTRKSRGWNVTACTGTCQTEEICQLQAARSQNNCAVTKPGLNVSAKRSEDAAAEAHNDCGPSLSMKTLGALAVREDLVEGLERKYMKLKEKKKL